MANKSEFIRSTSSSQRIIFSNSEDEGECPSTPCNENAAEINSTISKKLLFSSEDEELPEVLKSRYDGPTGYKLFSMQQKIGLDTRFQVNETFLDDSDVQREGNDKLQSDSTVQHEKSQALNILDSMFSKVSRSESKSEGQPTLPVSDIINPTISENAAQEQYCTLNQTLSVAADSHQISEQTLQEPERSQNATERFYVVNPNLTSLFGMDDVTHHFAFLHNERDDISATLAQPVQTDATSEAVSTKVESTGQKLVTQPKSPDSFCFFFHSSNSARSNRLNENSFYCSGALDEIENKWKILRPKMKECCRQRWKDAIKRTRRFKSRGSLGRA